MLSKSFTIIFILFLNISLSIGQNGAHIFNNENIHEIRISFVETNFLQILNNNYEQGGMGAAKVPYLMGNVNIDGVIVDSIGVRFKGFTSYSFENSKNPIKLDFNEFVKGKSFDDLKKLNLNNATGDPSMLRDVICYDLLRNSGVAAPRTSFSNVYINDVFWGFYQNIEQVDKTFIKNNFTNKGGNLFKNKEWNNFEYPGEDENDYHPPFELKTNRSEADWGGLINLMRVLSDSLNPNLASEIEEVFNVDLYLKTLAVDVATDNWDSNLEHGRNWYMYEDTVTGQFNWIPWDYNFALGSNTFESSDSECFIFSEYIYIVKDSVTVDFTGIVFGSPAIELFWDFGDGETSSSQKPTHKYSISGEYNVCFTAILNDTCSSETCYVINTNNIMPTCPVILDGSCPHPENEAFNLVINFQPSCCDDWSQGCEDFYLDIYENSGSGDGGFGGSFSIDQKSSERRLINRLLNIPEFNDRYYDYFCDLVEFNLTEERIFKLIDNHFELINESVENDINSLFSYDQFLKDMGRMNDTIGLKYFVSQKIMNLKEQMDTLDICDDLVNNPIAWHDIVINEFVASNDSTSGHSDPNGQYEDWIEIYNNTSSSIDLSEVYLSDKPSSPKKWQFPLGTEIAANDYLIVWADKDEDEEGVHSNFKIKRSGDELMLSNNDGSLIDSISFDEQTTNVAMARRPNGTGEFLFQESTLGGNNNTVSTSNLEQLLAVTLYPNPASQSISISIRDNKSPIYYLNVYSGSGVLIQNERLFHSSFIIDVKDFENGLYIVQLRDLEGKMVNKKIIVSH